MGIHDLIIIGGGPAGAAAGVYAARKHIKTAIIVESFGGQPVEAKEIQNWIGTIAISGINLAKKFKEHIKFYANGFVEIRETEKVKKIEKMGEKEYKEFMKNAAEQYAKSKKMSEDMAKQLVKDAQQSWKHFSKHLGK